MLYLPERYRIRKQEREIALHGRKPGQRPITDVAQIMLKQFVREKFGNEYLLADLAPARNLGVQLSELSDCSAIHQNARRASGLVVLGGLAVETERLVFERAEQSLNVPFEKPKKIQFRSGLPVKNFALRQIASHCRRGRCQTNAGMLSRSCAGGLVNVSNLEKSHALHAAVQVVRQHVQHARHQRTAHQRRFLAERIREFNNWRRRKRLRILMRDKCERDRFVVSQGEQGRSHLRMFCSARIIDNRA